MSGCSEKRGERWPEEGHATAKFAGAPPYRYFVDSGFFLGPEQSTALFLVAKNSGYNGLQQKSEEVAFPQSTKYRYSGGQKY